MMKSCKETCELLSQQADRKLTWQERLQLKMHLGMCYGCRRYAKQISAIETCMALLRERWRPLPENENTPDLR